MKYTFRDYHLFQLLRRFDNQHLPLDLFLNQYFKANQALGSKDRREIAETVFGMIRWRLLLDYLIGANPSWEKRVNLYRKFQPMQYGSVNSIPPHIRLSCPKELYEELLVDYGMERASYLCQINNTQAPITVRVNTLKTSRQHMLELWKNEGYDVAACQSAPHGIEFKKRVSLTAMPQFAEGLFEIQDEGSQRVADLIDAKPSERILDYCAGAGGKSLAIAPKMYGKGQLFLHDIRPAALVSAKKRFRRAGIQHAQFLDPTHPQLSKLKGQMDWVIADVPCSGTGTFRRHPDQKWKFSSQSVAELVCRQREIVQEAMTYLKEKGKLVYITCSILKKENEQQVAYFLKHLPLRAVGEPLCIHPSFGGMDGFFAFTFEKSSPASYRS